MNWREVTLAKLANPYLNTDINLCFEIDEKLLKFIEENKISLLLKEKGIKTKIAAEDEKKLRIILEELGNITKSFEGEGIEYTIIKFPELPRVHRDIDILISKSQIDDVDAIMKNLDYEKKEDQEIDKIAYFKVVNGNVVDIDVHLEIGWWGVSYLKSDDILKCSKICKFKGFKIRKPCKEYELLIYAATVLFGELHITLFDLIYVKNLIDRVTLSTVRSIALINNWLRQFDYFIKIVNRLYDMIWKNEANKISLPYRLPVRNILTARTEKALSDFRTHGFKKGMMDIWCYTLEVLQLGIDYIRVKFNIPSYSILNMRRFLWR